MKNPVLPALIALSAAFGASAQTPSLYNTVGGAVWVDADSNNVRNPGEKLVPGILVTLVAAENDSTVASALTDASGAFTLNNYFGTGTYYLNYVYPSAGYVPVFMRAGSDNEINSAADSTTVGKFDNYTVSTPYFEISDNTDLKSYGLGLHRIGTTLTYWASSPMTPTSWSKIYKLPKSRNSLAIASKASILVNEAVIHPFIGFENTGESAEPGTVEGSGRLSMVLPGGSIPQIASLVVKDVTFAPYDDRTDYAGPSGYNWADSYAAGHSAANITLASQLSAYRSSASSDSISITANAVSTTTITGSSNLRVSVSTISGAGVFVTYTYPNVVALPIRLTSFAGSRDGAAALLRWEASATAADLFIIERSTDGASFTEIGRTAPAGNGTGGAASYRFADQTPSRGVNYYRLRMPATDGLSEFSNIAAVSFGSLADGAAPAFPNPATGSLTVAAAANSRISLLNAAGQAVATAVTREPGNVTLNVSGLPAGVYTLRVDDPQNTLPYTGRVVIQRP